MVRGLSQRLGLIVGIFLSSVLLTLPIQQAYAVEWETYEDEDLGFSIDYPAKWEEGDAADFEEEIEGVIFMCPKFVSSDGEEGCCALVGKEYIEEGETIEEHVEGDVAEADGDIDEDWWDEISGVEAYYTIVTFPSDRTSIMVHCWVPGEEEEAVWMVECETDTKKFDSKRKFYFDPMIDSFEIL